MEQVFYTQKNITFREADPAQIMFFGNVFDFAHDCFEQFVQATGYSWKEWFQDPQIATPIRHTDADFRAPFLPGEAYDIAVTVTHLGETSFKMKYVFSQQSRVHALVNMVHTAIDIQTKQKIALPALLRERFGRFLEGPRV